MPPATTKSRDAYYRRKYGITLEQYDLLFEQRAGGCWICGRGPTKRRLHVEHDHKTGRVRGLACWSCNMLLRHAHDNSVILRNAADYLESREADAVLGREPDAQV